MGKHTSKKIKPLIAQNIEHPLKIAVYRHIFIEELVTIFKTDNKKSKM